MADSSRDDDVLLELKDIHRFYGEGDSYTEVLKGINLTVRRGELVAIVGPSGSGKSTLMNILGCLDQPSVGTYLVAGKDTAQMLPDELAALRRDYFGFIFQRYHLLGHLTASENVQVPAVYSGFKKEKRTVRADELLIKLGMGDRIDHKPSKLSGGQQQRVSIARALMNGGEIILADEPTGALDTESGTEVMKVLKDLNRQGHTIIIITHDPRIAAQVHREITIQDGRIKGDTIHEGNPQGGASAENPEALNLKAGWLHSISSYIDRFREAYVMAWRAMISNRMRTLLTMLGIIIGIMAVVSVVALARGASDQVIANISSMGTNTITVMPGERMGDVRSGRVRTLSIADLKALQGQPFVDSASPTVQSSSSLLRRFNIENNGSVYGVNDDYFRVYGMEIAKGRIFSEEESDNSPQICVIDNNTAKNMFPGQDPLGQRLLIDDMPVQVIGVLTDKEVAFRPSDSLYVYVPYSTIMNRLMNQKYLSSIIVRIADGFSSAVAENSLVTLLQARHGRKDFFLMSSDTIMKSIGQTTTTFTLLISAIAVISLIVGGIGVMNIMLVSVTERTREIGIRMAVGARQSDIMTQFLIESVTVCIIGGLAGVLFSVGMGTVLTYLMPSIPMSFSLISIVVAVITSCVIGMVFGFMPARNAARLNPVDALARE